MKRIRVTYSWHEARKSSGAERHTSSFAIEVEDEVFADCVEQKLPYRFGWPRTIFQVRVAELTYWHAAMHNRYVLRGDHILSIEGVEA